MPLLNKKSFVPEPLPSNLRPDEEVFVCQATKEVFRDYEKFFNRHFLCNSLVWSCELTGSSNLTYQQALDSENEARKLMDSLPECYQRASLSLVHHARRTNVKVLCDEICSFYRERFVVGERVSLMQTTSSGAKILSPAQVIKVIPPELRPSPKSPVRVPVIALSPVKTPSHVHLPPHPCPPETTPSVPQPVNSLHSTPPGGAHVANGPQDTSDFKPPKSASKLTPKTPSTPLTPEVALKPADYKYMVDMVQSSEPCQLLVQAKQLSRSKGALNPKKLKLFLRNALQRPSEKHPFYVKDEYVRKFRLGPCTVPPDPLPSPTPRSRKRTLSQASLDSFLTPGSVASSSESKKSRPTSLDTSGKPRKARKKKTPKTPSARGRKNKKTPKALKLFKGKSPYSATPVKAQRSPKKTPKSPKAQLTTPRSPLRTPSSPRHKMEALKVLHKAKKFKQMDLKKSVVRAETMRPLSEEELRLLRQSAEEDRQRRLAQKEAEKQQRREARLQKVREQQEQKRQERLRQREWLRPREDLLCGDSKPLPKPVPVDTKLPQDLFGDAVMILEFLHTFGPLFNIREAIHGSIVFEKIEYALISCDSTSLLFEIMRFLLQAIFATMEEEKESSVRVSSKKSPEEAGESKNGNETGTEAVEEKGETKTDVVGIDEEDAKKGGGDVGGRVMLSDEEMDTGEEEDPEVEKPLDLRVESIMTSAVVFAKWSNLTQQASLMELVLDPYTCTEVLRLHLLSSGGYRDVGDRNWFRHARRGGYADSDDPAVALRLRRPDILDSLARVSAYDLSPADKLEVLSTLCSQLLSYSVTREYMEESAVRAKKARKQIRGIQFSEERRKKEEKAALHKEKMEKAKLKKKEKEDEKKKPEGDASSGTITADVSLGMEANKSTEDAVGSDQATQGLRPQAETQPDDTKPPLESQDKKESNPPDKSSSRETRSPSQEGSELEEERKARMEEELHELHDELAEASTAVNLRPLGCDRHHRRYWLFPSLPGLYVEDAGHFPVELPTQAGEADISTPAAGAITIRTEENRLPSVPTQPRLLQSVVGLTDAPPKPEPGGCIDLTRVEQLVHYQQQSTSPAPDQECRKTFDSRLTWSYYTSPEDLDALITSLNTRGLREVELKKALESHRALLVGNLQKCPFLPVGIKTTEASTTDAALQYTSADQYLELYLREQILDIEEKIYVGNLGYLKDLGTCGRDEWRAAIENSGAAAPVKLTTATSPGAEVSDDQQPCNGGGGGGGSRAATPIPGGEEGSRLKSGAATPVVNPSVRELAKALLQVQAGIEKKFLMPPLGTAIDHKRKQKGPKKNGMVKEGDVCLEQWRSSLSKSTNFSQIFVHLATLERAVMWSKSLMNVRCRICRRKGGDEYMLLCDGCDHGYHTYCLRPPLQYVPEGDWFCYDCKPITPVKPRRRAPRVIFQEEESSESEAEGERESGGSEEEDSGEEEENEDSEEEQEEAVPTGRGLRSRGRGAIASGIRRSNRLQPQFKKKLVAKGKTLAKKGSKRVTFASEETESIRPGSKTPEVSTKYEITKARKKLKLDSMPSPVHQSKAEIIIASIIDLRCSQHCHTSASRREQKGLEAQLCGALLAEVGNREDSWHFANPVKRRSYPDYYDAITEPMDLRTVRSKIKCGKYENLHEFLQDVELIFANCLKYHKRHSEIGKAGSALKRFFEKRCSDLGLKDLFPSDAVKVSPVPGISLRSSGRRRK